MASRMRWIGVAVVLMLLCNFSISVRAEGDEEEEQEEEHVLTLDHSNFTETVSSHDFIVVEFYAPWCGYCKKLAPEYEEAASVLSRSDPPLTLAKIDASAEENREVVTKYEIQGFPTIKIFRNGGNDVREYKGPLEAAGIATYLKKQAGPASVELKTPDDVQSSVDEAKVVVVGIFPSLSGEEFENFTTVADKLRSDYDFCHTLDAKLLPKGESSLNKPTVRLLKPFDELFVDFTDFDMDSLEKFIEEASVPIVTVYDNNPNNQPFFIKFFNSPESKVMLLANFDNEDINALTTAFKDVATTYKGKGVIFLLGEVGASQSLIQYFGLKPDQMPLIIVQTSGNKKYLKSNLKPSDIASWFKEYMEGNVKPFVKSEPIPEANNEPVKVVVANSLKAMVFESGKTVLLEFYAPWCGHCRKLAPILNEVALSFKNDPEILIAKMDATANDFPTEMFEVEGLPTMYLKSSTGRLSKYEGDRSKEGIIDFIEKNRDKTVQSSSDAESATARDEL